MINERIEKAFNKQINEELHSAYIYMSMAGYFDAINLKGCAHWMHVQAKEEMEHAEKFYKHIIDRGGKVRYTTIEGPKVEWSSPLAAFEDAYKHECHITKCIHDLVKLSKDENDYPSATMLNWFVDEQVEEEANTDEIVQKLKMIKDSPNALFMLDKHLGDRKE